MTDIDTELSKRFKRGLKAKYDMNLEELINWKFVGFFSNMNKDDIENTIDFHSKKETGQNIWNSYFPDIEIPTHLAEDKCVCDTKIFWNYILVEDEKAEEPNIIIIGSECIKHFEIDKISKKLKCKRCDNKVNNSDSGLCGDCRKKRFCPTCDKVLPKGKKGKYCGNKCDPDQCYICGGKKKYRNYPICGKCWYKYEKN